jgi:hypothetical protein
MSIFKENTRFAALIDDSSNQKINKKSDNRKEKKTDIVEEKKQDRDDKPKIESINSFKNDNYGFNRRDGFNSRENSRRLHDHIAFEKQEQERKEKLEEIKREQEKMIALDMSNFPELVKVSSTPVVEENTTNFLEKLKKNAKPDKLVESQVNPGWTELRKDKKTNQTIMNYHAKKDKKEYIKSSQDLAYDVLEYLVCLHEERSSKYIESWGYDEWEKMFTCPNYDYSYFDKLDEIYYKNNPESDQEYEYENDNYEHDEY